MLDRLRRLHPFQTPDAQRLAILFAVVYFAQGMWSLPNQTLIITLKERGLSAGQVATFFSFSIIPWLIKPAYGFLSDCVPLFGRRRKSYLLLTSSLAAGAGLAMGLAAPHSYWWLVGLITVMGLGLAFTDVLVDALMVESGKPRGLTGAFQAVQWAAIYTAAVLVGVLGGFLAERRSLSAAFTLAALFPLISFSMTLFVVHDPPARADRKAFRQTMAAVREAVGGRDLWIVAGFIFFWTFSPSFGPALLYYQTDALKFSQQFIGHLGALGFEGIVEYHVAEAVETLRTTPGPFDLIFNDIDKTGYPAALPIIKAKLRPGGLLITDNLLWHGRVFDSTDQSPETQAIREFTRHVTEDSAWTAMVVPIRDGLLVARRN